MAFFATHMLFHFRINPVGWVSAFALIIAGMSWVAADKGLGSRNSVQKRVFALTPFLLLSFYLFSEIAGSLGCLFGVAHLGGWSRVFSAEECVAIYILLAVALMLAFRVLRIRGLYFRVTGSIQFVLALILITREVYTIKQWWAWASQIE